MPEARTLAHQSGTSKRTSARPLWLRVVWRPEGLCHLGSATPAIELGGNQLGELGRDICHRIFCSAQATSRSEQGADFAESFIRRFVHDRNEQVTREDCRKFFVGNALFWEAAQQRRGYQHDSDSRFRQALVDGAEQRLAEDNVLLAEPDRDAARLEQIVQLLGGRLPVVLRVAEEDISKIGHGCSLLDVFADRCECPYLCVRVCHGRTGW